MVLAFERSKEPVSDVAGAYEQRIATRGILATGTLACPRCDAPVVLATEPVARADRLDCPFCAHTAVVRDFL
jgi:ribosomal protein S27AE